MRIRNDYGQQIFWRAFRENDTIYGVGLKQGTIAKDKTGSWREDSFSKIKIEIKKKNMVGKFLTRAGTKFNMTDDMIVDAGGKLAVARLTLSDQDTATVRRHGLQFVDLRGFDEKVERQVTSSIESVFSTSSGFERLNGSETAWSVEGKVGGKIGKTKEAEISAGFQQRTIEQLTERHSETVSHVWKQSWQDTFPLTPGKIHAIDIAWIVGMRTGKATYFGEEAVYSAVVSAKAELTTASSYAAPEEMPEDVRAAWNATKG
jgi:hypothetical protein